MNIRYRVELSEAERSQLMALLSGGKQAARKLKRAQILLATDAGVSDEVIANSVSVGGSTVYRTKRRFVEGNLELALTEEARPGAARKLSGKETALLVAAVDPVWWSPPHFRRRLSTWPKPARLTRLNFVDKWLNWFALAAIRMTLRESSNQPRSRSATGSAWPIERTDAGRRRPKLSHRANAMN
jgi:hypothetical protein